ncbi:hypothetical protein MKW92_047575 [Papaver armeniacum]|nr:hypothetical protein MKW92_047575 [Papaver armeniacum]
MGLHLLLKFQCFILLLCLHLASAAEIPMINASRIISKPGCQDMCGNVSIPYPFGIGHGCFIDSFFEIVCNDTIPGNTRPVYGVDLNVSDISIAGGEMTTSLAVVTNCSDESIETNNHFNGAHFNKFTFSSTKNKFIAIGCDTLAYIVGKGFNSSVGTGCMSYCNKIEDTTDGICNGVGCCEASIPAGLMSYETNLMSMFDPRKNLIFNPCSYAFLAERSSFNFSKSYLKNFKNHGTLTVPVVVDWTIGTKTCEEAQRNFRSYACGPNTDCIPAASSDVEGYRCSCLTGYEGNPYLNKSTGGHCQDIDECERSLHNCAKGPGDICINTQGSYNCSCSKGYRPDVRNNITDCILLESHVPGSPSTENNNQNNNLGRIAVGKC